MTIVGVADSPQMESQLLSVDHSRSAFEELISHFDDDVSFDPVATSTAQLPDPKPIVMTVGQGIVDVMTGVRPVSQLTGKISTSVYTALNDIAIPNIRSRRPLRQRVTSMHMKSPTDGVVEASLVVTNNRRSKALALRFEGLDGKWKCTAIQTSYP